MFSDCHNFSFLACRDKRESYVFPCNIGVILPLPPIQWKWWIKVGSGANLYVAKDDAVWLQRMHLPPFPPAFDHGVEGGEVLIASIAHTWETDASGSWLEKWLTPSTNKNYVLTRNIFVKFGKSCTLFESCHLRHCINPHHCEAHFPTFAAHQRRHSCCKKEDHSPIGSTSAIWFPQTCRGSL